MDSEVIQEKNENIVPRKIGGWLILFALGVFVSPIRILYYLATKFPPVFSENTWQSLTDPASESYSSLWAPLLIGECAFNIVLLFVSIFMVVLLIRKKSIFPKIYAGVAIAFAIFIIIDAYIATLIMPNISIFESDTTWGLVSYLIWTPYLFISQRSKETFIK